MLFFMLEAGNIHGLMLGIVGVADTGQHIGNRISDVHTCIPPILELQADAC